VGIISRNNTLKQERAFKPQQDSHEIRMPVDPVFCHPSAAWEENERAPENPISGTRPELPPSRGKGFVEVPRRRCAMPGKLSDQ
jgi:hypothetical protein